MKVSPWIFSLIFAFCIALDLVFPFQAQAGYLDPGSGSLLVQGIVAVLAFFGKVVDSIKRLFGFSAKDED